MPEFNFDWLFSGLESDPMDTIKKIGDLTLGGKMRFRRYAERLVEDILDGRDPSSTFGEIQRANRMWAALRADPRYEQVKRVVRKMAQADAEGIADSLLTLMRDDPEAKA